MTTTALVIATRDRAEMLAQTVKSALEQTEPFSRIVISINSSSDAMRNLTLDALQPFINQKPDQMTVSLTPRDMPSDEHTTYMQEHLFGDENYTVLFHDDDLMEPGYHAAVKKILDQRPDVVAASCNARLLLENTLTQRTSMGPWSGMIEINSPEELLATYMDFCPIGPPPLCGYIHRTNILKKLAFQRYNGGKYSDVAGLTQLASKGKIIWLSDTHIQYRIHQGQSSQTVSTRDYYSLVRYLLENNWLPADSPLFHSYRFKHLRLKLRMMNNPSKRRTANLVRGYLLRTVLSKYIFKSRFHLNLIRRLLRQ